MLRNSVSKGFHAFMFCSLYAMYGRVKSILLLKLVWHRFFQGKMIFFSECLVKNWEKVVGPIECVVKIILGKNDFEKIFDKQALNSIVVGSRIRTIQLKQRRKVVG